MTATIEHPFSIINCLKPISLVGLFILLIQTSNLFASPYKHHYVPKYKPNVEFVGKFGSSRNIYQLGAVLPLLQTPEDLVYIPAFAMLDSKKANEVNAGLGFRKLFHAKCIMGLYSFFDYRKSHLGNFFKQITFGYEFFTQLFELRANVYLPLNKSKTTISTQKKSVVMNYDGHNTSLSLSRWNDKFVETPNKGFDVEIGITTSFFGLHGAYYSFFEKNSTSHGGRARANVRINPWTSIEGEINYDTARKLTSYAGIRLNFPSKSIYKQTRLQTKMTSLPVRDIDIVVSQVSSAINTATTCAKAKGLVILVEPNADQKSKLIARDVYTVNRRYMNSKSISDVAIIKDGAFVFVGKIATSVIPLNTLEASIINNVHKNHILRSEGDLFNLIERGFWSNETMYQTHLARINDVRSKNPAINIPKGFVEKLVKAKRGINAHLLPILLQARFKNRDDVFILNLVRDTKSDSLSSNIADLQSKLFDKHSKFKNPRYIASMILQPHHATALIVDRQTKQVIYSDSNNHPMSKKQETIFASTFPKRIYQYVNYTPCLQNESYSCGLHTMDTITGYLNGAFKIGDPRLQRNTKDLYEEYVLETSANRGRFTDIGYR